MCRNFLWIAGYTHFNHKQVKEIMKLQISLVKVFEVMLQKIMGQESNERIIYRC